MDLSKLFARFQWGTLLTFQLNRVLVEGRVVGYIIQTNGDKSIVIEDAGGNLNIRPVVAFTRTKELPAWSTDPPG